MLLELSRAVTGQLDRATLLEAIRIQAGRILDASNMAIVLRDEERGDLEVVLRVVDGVPDMRTPLRYPARTVGLMSAVLETGQAAADRGLSRRVRAARARAGRDLPRLAVLARRADDHRGHGDRRADLAQPDARLRRRRRTAAVEHRSSRRAGAAQRAALRGADPGLQRAGLRAGPARADREAARARRDGLGGGARLQQPARVDPGPRPAHAPALARPAAPQVAPGHRALRARRGPDGAAAARVHADPPRSAVRGGRPQRDRARRARDHPVALARGDAKPRCGHRGADVVREPCRRSPAIPPSCARR